MEVPRRVVYRGMEKFYRKEGTKMKLIWKELLHANYRCGRMHTNRAPASDVYCMLPSAVRMCTRM